MTHILEEFKHPTNQSRPRLRYWWPGGYVANYLAELDQEISEIAEAGFGGIEISDVYDALSEQAADQLQPEEYGFTSANWKKAVKQAMRSAKKHQLKVDLTLGPHWPATTNEADPNQVGTAKELVYGTHTFTGSIAENATVLELCPPHYKTSETKSDGGEIENKLIAVYIAEQQQHSEIDMPPAVPWEEPYTVISDQIAFSSLKEVTQYVQSGKFLRTIPAEYEQSILIAVYERGTGQRVNMFSMGSKNRPDVMAPYAYVVDHFSPQGAEFIQKLWEKNFLNDPEFVALLNEVGDCFFEDSLELQSVGHWTNNLLAEFQTRMGYDLQPYLPFVLGINQDKGLGLESSSFQVEATDQPKVAQLRHDYFLVLNQLYQEYHLQPLKQWANQLNMNYRAQTYGWAIDSAVAAAQLDVAEGESLGFGEDGNDAFRLLAAGRDFGGLEILSDEAGAYLFQGYATTLPQLFATLHKNYLAGVNQTYWHGIPFKYAPDAKWPGFSAFTPMLGGRGFAESWGSRQPIWKYLKPYTTYLGRVHALLRYGLNQLDVLVYQAGHNASEHKKIAVGEQLTRLGYRYQVMTEGLFQLSSTVENQQLRVAGATYQSVLIPTGTLLTKAAKIGLAEWEKQGVQVIWQKSDQLSELTEVLAVSGFANSAGNILTYQRTDEDRQFIFCYNQGTQAVELNSFLSKQQVISEWFPWSGDVGAVQTATLQAGDLRIFEVMDTGTTILPAQQMTNESLKHAAWQLTLESWTMQQPDELVTLKKRFELELAELQAWTNIAEYEHVSGIGHYQTLFEIHQQKPVRLLLPNVTGSLQVKLNDQILVGNPLTGEYGLPAEQLKTQNQLEITIASTLNNYLNASPLTEYYHEYPQQVYGLEQAFLIYE